MIIHEALYFRRRLSDAYSSLHQLCSSLHSILIERTSLESPFVDNIK